MHSDEDGKFGGQSDDETDQNTLLDVLSVVEDVARELADADDPKRSKFADELEHAMKALRRGLPD